MSTLRRPQFGVNTEEAPVRYVKGTSARNGIADVRS